MSVEPAGLERVLARMAELSARFGPPPEPPPARESPPAGRPDATSAAAGTRANDFSGALLQASRSAGVDPRLLAAVVRVESDGDPRARSPKGALGLMQLMPGTAKRFGVTDPYDPAQNLLGGGRHLRQLIDRYGGDLSLGLAAYNAGENAVARHNGIPPYRETQAFVRRVLDIYQSNQP